MNAFSASIRLSTGSVSVSSTCSFSSSGFAGTFAGVLRLLFGDLVGAAAASVESVATLGEGCAAGLSTGSGVFTSATGLSVGSGDAFGVGVPANEVSDGCAVGVVEGEGCGVSTTGVAGEALGVGCATGVSLGAGVCVGIAAGCGDGVSLGCGDGVSVGGGAGLSTTRGRVCAIKFSEGFWSSDSKVKLFRSPRMFTKVSI